MFIMIFDYVWVYMILYAYIIYIWICMIIYDYIWLISDCMWLYMIVYDYTWLYDCICMALLVLQWPIDHSTANYWWIVPMPGDGSCARVPNGSGPTKVGFRAPQAYDNHQLHFHAWGLTPFHDPIDVPKLEVHAFSGSSCRNRRFACSLNRLAGFWW